MKFIVVVEHLEPCINRWILAEYSYVSKLFPGRVLFSNVKKENHRSVLEKLGAVEERSVTELGIDGPETIVLDPRAEEELHPSDLESARYVVIGGIMGSHPPEGRTWKYITQFMPCSRARNLGPYQLTIAGAAYVVKKVSEGIELRNVRMVYGLSIERSMGRGIELSIYLPYAFPLDEHGRLALPENYIDIVAEYVIIYEQRALGRGDDYVCENG